MAISQTINPMVNVPSISDLVNFEANVDYTLNTGLQTRATEMNTFASQANSTAATINAQAIAMSLNSTIDTSTTSNTIGTGSKTFTVSASKSFVAGMYIVIADTAAASTNSMYCQVTSYSGTTLVVNVISILGSGTKTAWSISQSSVIAGSNIYSQANILGTVSQSGGVPTGAIIETGSNANGNYTKFADGTMICRSFLNQGTRAITSSLGSLFYLSTPITVTYPSVFVGTTPSVSINVWPTSGLVWSSLSGASTSDVAFYLISPSSSSVQVYSFMTAVGRWY